MTVDEAVRARVLALSAVTALVGQRVTSAVVPQGQPRPYVLIQLIDDQVPYHLRGPAGTKSARVQVEARADVGDAKATAENVMAGIDGNGFGRSASGLAGWIGGIGSPAFEIMGVFPQSIQWTYDPEQNRLFRMWRDYIVHWKE